MSWAVVLCESEGEGRYIIRSFLGTVRMVYILYFDPTVKKRLANLVRLAKKCS